MLFPRFMGLQELLDICADFATRNNIIFNEQSVYIFQAKLFEWLICAHSTPL